MVLAVALNPSKKLVDESEFEVADIDARYPDRAELWKQGCQCAECHHCRPSPSISLSLFSSSSDISCLVCGSKICAHVGRSMIP